ncbi:hypothetical protein D910_12835 [Dendroctonus ponderosae]|uniref:Protein krueppel n=1 Tax=Dendroctonus ponderosae TaxID=77166 RepID=U4UNA8_DENPD|nr:hypothetical protein D910_12835 [Dendroctonus ponderosae]
MELNANRSFCRLCLSTSAIYYSLLKDDGKEMLLALTGITDLFELQVNEEECPTDSCVKCWLNLKSAYSIQQRFIEADRRFRTTGLHSSLDLEEDTMNDSHLNFIKVETESTEAGSPLNASKMLEEEDTNFSELIYIRTEGEVIETESNCYICNVKCEDDAALQKHTNSHFNDEQPCDSCRLSLPNIEAYRDHIQVKHPDLVNRVHNCGICGHSFRYLTLYETHLAAVHPTTARTRHNRRDVSRFLKSDSLNCDHCNKTFGTRRSLNTHLKGHIKKPCPICNTLITVYNLSKHVNNHAAHPAVCHLCGITAKNPESLRGHMYYTHSQKRLKCDYCGRIFKKLYAYKMHIKKEHTGERSFTCDSCGKRFFTNYELNNHIRSRHLKERNHICQYCKKGFSSRFSMRTHERQHTNETPYVCEVCGQGFRQNVSLRAHRRSKHNIEEDKVAECPVCKKMFRDDWALKSHTRSVHD